MLLYVAGPYNAEDANKRLDNILAAGAVAADLWKRGHAVICPHANTNEFQVPIEGGDTPQGWKDIIRGDLMMLARCDGIVMLPTWKASRGANIEHDYAESLGMPIWYWPDAPELHVTEERCPDQVKAFAEELGRMYRVHLDKNADYSPANILMTGEVGLATRLWDKIARILNLTGFKLNVAVGDFDQSREPMNESLNDAYRDAAVYSVIGLLLRRDQWGH